MGIGGQHPRVARAHRSRSAVSLRLAIVAALLGTLLPVASVLGLVSAAITIDGDLDDWSGILASADNVVSDPIGTADPDNPGTANRDINQLAFTWDDDNLYLYIRRTASGSNSVSYLAYLDVDNDALLEGTDFLAVFNFNGSAFQAGSSGVYQYAPSSPAGDPLGGDGYRPPGTLGAVVPGTLSADSATDGIRHEASIPWSSIALAPGAPVVVRLGTSLNTNLPSSIQDTTNAASLVWRSASLSAGTTKGGLAGGTVVYEHSLTNAGNVADTYTLVSVSARGWPLTLTDETGTAVSQVTLAPGETVTLSLSVTIPEGTADGVRDTLTLSATGQNGFPSMSATDIVIAGDVIVIPDLVNDLAPGNVSVFRNRLMNNAEVPLTVDLAAGSSKGYAVTVYMADGITPFAPVLLPPGGSVPVQVHVAIPPGAPIGTSDVTVLSASAIEDPTIGATGTDTTRVRPPLVVEPDNAGAAGAGTEITYLHTVANCTPDTSTVDLTATSAWPVQVLAADGVTPISSVVLPPFGGSTQVRVRVSIPSDTASGASNTTTLRGTSGALVESATDVTTVSNLVLFADSARTTPATDYLVGDSVYAYGSGLPSGGTVRFRWLDPAGTAMYTSPLMPVDVARHATASYTLPLAGPVGQWDCVVLSSKGAELGREPLYVGYRGQISSLAAADVTDAAGSISVSAELANDSGLAASGTEIAYLVWYDVDYDGACSNGDLYVDAAGATQTYTGTGTESTHVTNGFSVGANGSFGDSWSIPAADLPDSGTYRVFVEWRDATGRTIASAATTFEATILRIEMTVSETVIDAGTVDPGVATNLPAISISVDANSYFDLYTTKNGDVDLLGLSTSLAAHYGEPSGQRFYTDTLTLQPPWTTLPGPLSATVVYTAVLE